MFYRYTKTLTRDSEGNETMVEDYDSTDKEWVAAHQEEKGPEVTIADESKKEPTESYYPPFTMDEYERDKGAREYPKYDQADDVPKQDYKEPSEKEMTDHRANRLKTFREKYLNEKNRADYYLSREQGMDSPEPTPQEDTDEMIDALERLDSNYAAVEAFNNLRRKIFASKI